MRRTAVQLGIVAAALAFAAVPAAAQTEGSIEFEVAAPSGPMEPASPIAQAVTIFKTDFTAAGVGAMRNQGVPHTITVAGIAGPVTGALLYWHGPTDTNDPTANANVFVDGNPVVGTNIGFSDDNCWNFANSQAYVADVTTLVQGKGNGAYVLTGFGFGRPVNTNGASMLVFYTDADPTNNRDLVIYDGNDSNINNIYDPPGWTVSLSGIAYVGGTAGLQMHIADGQNFIDDALVINAVQKIPISNWATGFTVPGVNNGPTGNGRLWDIINIDVTPDLAAAGPPPQTLNITSGVVSDCLALVVAVIDLPAGAAPGQPADIDIKFCSNPNGYHCQKKGVLPVTVFGTAGLDVTDIDFATLQLCLASDLSQCTSTPPRNWTFADRGDPTTDLGAAQCQVIDGVEQDFLNPDGLLDVDVRFESQEVAQLIDCGSLNKKDESPTLVLVGKLLSGADFQSFPLDDVGIDRLYIQ